MQTELLYYMLHDKLQVPARIFIYIIHEQIEEIVISKKKNILTVKCNDKQSSASGFILLDHLTFKHCPKHGLTS